jgi:hypothetical protein
MHYFSIIYQIELAIGDCGCIVRYASETMKGDMTMASSIQEVYKKKENCIRDIQLAREMFGKKSSTPKQFNSCTDSLGFMMLYAPEDILPMVQATLSELVMRRSYRIMGDAEFRKQTIELEKGE